ncbi:MAG TPA: tRNA cyclic N6-threonylcarbamoyladenosine(37) synthase TcdA [Aeromonadales bacterium]|nr:tRNA cyclic N6-threonylcarbamoyladenosine(37) synthase TcdA [Aeromonadales bacterium]
MPVSHNNFSASYWHRFSGIARLYGEQGLDKIQNSHIFIVGIGGVGSWVAEALARTGVGEITLMDMDEICISNINRQVHALTSTVGQSKIEVMARRLEDINPEIMVHQIDEFLSRDNIVDYVSKEYDFVVDAIDSVISKAALIVHCKRNKIPMLTIGGAGAQRDPQKIKINDLSRSSGDPLLAKIRNELRRKHNYSRNTQKKFGIQAVYSDEQLYYPQTDGSVCHARPQNMDSAKLDCSKGFGAASFITASFAFVACSHILEKITR